jgi:thymidylate synthase (FAD)
MIMVEICAIKFPDFAWLRNVTAIIKSSYHDKTFFEILEELKDEEVEPFLTKIIDLGHESALEHITFTFLIYDISRWATHQLVRHRISSYTQKTLRKERIIDDTSFVVDDVFPEKLLPALKKYYETVSKFYTELLQRDVAPEVVRAILPGSIKSEIAWTVNLRALRNFLQQRLTKTAQAEIRELAEKIVSIFEDLEVEYLLKGVAYTTEVLGD